MPYWLELSLIILETLCCLYLLMVSIHICCKYSNFIFKKIPMTMLYIFAVLGILSTAILVWFIGYFDVNAQIKIALYCFTQLCTLALQHCLITNLLEFYLQSKSLVEGNFLQSSVASCDSFASSIREQVRKQKQNSKFVAIVLLGLVFIDIVFCCISCSLVLTKIDTLISKDF